jgi:hypothetical protein
VATEPSSLVVMALGYTYVVLNGTMYELGNPLTIFLISTFIGIVESFA